MIDVNYEFHKFLLVCQQMFEMKNLRSCFSFSFKARSAQFLRTYCSLSLAALLTYGCGRRLLANVFFNSLQYNHQGAHYLAYPIHPLKHDDDDNVQLWTREFAFGRFSRLTYRRYKYTFLWFQSDNAAGIRRFGCTRFL